MVLLHWLAFVLAGSTAFPALADLAGFLAPLMVAQPGATTPDWTKSLFRVRRQAPVRVAPRLDVQPHGVLSPGQQILVTAQVKDRDWFRVETRDGLEGFVIGSLIRPDEAAKVIDLALWPHLNDGTVRLEPLAPFDVADIDLRALTAEDKRRIQKTLVYLGYYESVVDGQFGERSFAAIRDFQQSRGDDPTGQLTRVQYRELMARANDRLTGDAMQTLIDTNIGYRVDYPSNLLPLLDRLGDEGWRLSDNAGQAEISITVGPESADLESRYDRLTAPPGQIAYGLLRDRLFVVAGQDGSTGFYHVGKAGPVQLIEMRLTYAAANSQGWERFAAVLFNSFEMTIDRARP